MATWESIYQDAKAAGCKWPEVLSAQFILESGHGQYQSGKFNYFGIKAGENEAGTVTETQEWSNGKFITIKDKFKDFANQRECVQWLVDHWYKDWSGHKGVNRAKTADECCDLLVVEKYATDPEYSAKLKKIVREYYKPSTAGSVATEGEEIELENFFTFFDNLPHQVKGIQALESEIRKVAPGLLMESAEWVKEYRQVQVKEVKQPPSPIAGDLVQLNVPYLYQLDSHVEGQGWRMCFSSTNAMLLEFLKPGTLKGPQADDTYLRKVFNYGDTTSAEAQVKALAAYGLKASFKTNGTSKRAKELLRQGIPVPVGVLHHGKSSSPSGSGHWLLLVGFDEAGKNWICHDPYGEMDVVNGNYLKNTPTAGRFVRYSYSNLNRRWLVGGEGDGWFVEAVK